MTFPSQTDLYNYAGARNADPTIEYVDTQGVLQTLQELKPLPVTQYGYSFRVLQGTDPGEMLLHIVQWMDYRLGTFGAHEEGHPEHAAVLVPILGGYARWMVIRGINVDEIPYPLPPALTVHGFWINDPLPASQGGQGQNKYFTASAWLTNRFIPPVSNDEYNGEYVAIVVEPWSACCVPGGSCLETGLVACTDAGGTLVAQTATCQGDADGDSVDDSCDNCPGVSDPDQSDTDGDGRGNLCDNCLNVWNPARHDWDSDGLGDACDVHTGSIVAWGSNYYGQCNVRAPNTDFIAVAAGSVHSLGLKNADWDDDGVPNTQDNCPGVPNPLQEDSDGDGIGNACEACVVGEPPVAEPSVPDGGSGTRVRYLAFAADPASAGRQQGIRVKFNDLPGSFAYAEGRTMWVGEPRTVCENAGQGTPPVGGCGPAPGLPSPTFWVAPLPCDPYFTDWSIYQVVHVYDRSIVPSGIYHMQMIDASCELTEEASYSEPLAVKTSQWGDLIKDCTTTPYGPPDGIVNVTTDVTAALDKFKNLPGAPAKSRCDLEPGEPDLRINITDVVSGLDAFKGFAYPFPGAPVTDPCP